MEINGLKERGRVPRYCSSLRQLRTLKLALHEEGRLKAAPAFSAGAYEVDQSQALRLEWSNRSASIHPA
ncbi:hypothetical protein D3C72_1830690 [compost metagenome]